MTKVIQTKPCPSCPDCGARMILRKPYRPAMGRKQFDPFWGCNRFPDCHGTRQVGADGKPEQDEESWEI